MTSVLSARARAQAIAVGRGGQHILAVPLALRLAAKIAERPWEAFLTNPTELANGLRDLVDAVGPDGVAVSMPEVLADDTGGIRLGCAVEATRRLRPVLGDAVALVAVLPAGDATLARVTAFLAAGIDGVVLAGDCPDDLARTVRNVTRFHRALAVTLAPGAGALAAAQVVGLGERRAASGLVLTDGEVPVSAGVPAVQDWVAALRGG